MIFSGKAGTGECALVVIMAASFPPLTDSLKSSRYIHKDSSVTAATELGVS